jgi:hypothetical protein
MQPVGPIEVKGKPGTLGRVDERVLVAWVVGGAAVLSAIYLALLALATPWRAMQRRAAAQRPLPAYPDPPPSFHPLAWQRWEWLPGCALLGRDRRTYQSSGRRRRALGLRRGYRAAVLPPKPLRSAAAAQVAATRAAKASSAPDSHGRVRLTPQRGFPSQCCFSTAATLSMPSRQESLASAFAGSSSEHSARCCAGVWVAPDAALAV